MVEIDLKDPYTKEQLDNIIEFENIPHLRLYQSSPSSFCQHKMDGLVVLLHYCQAGLRHHPEMF